MLALTAANQRQKSAPDGLGDDGALQASLRQLRLKLQEVKQKENGTFPV